MFSNSEMPVFPDLCRSGIDKRVKGVVVASQTSFSGPCKADQNVGCVHHAWPASLRVLSTLFATERVCESVCICV